jgi:OPA family sugar phosphate sensor protein UhpC-like MFS transporter
MSGLLTAFAPGGPAPPIAEPGRIDALYRRHRFRIMVAITLAYGLSYTCRLAIGVVKKPLLDQGIFTAGELGTIGSSLFYAYAFGKLFNGFFADHANVRRFLSFGIFCSALCNVGMGFSTHVLPAAIFWGLNGWFQSFGAPACVVAMTAWFSNRERGRMYGVWSTSHSIGEGLTFLVVGSLVAAFGWRAGYLGPAILCVAVAGFAYLWMREPPKTLGLPAVADWKDDHWQGAGAAAAGQSLIATQLSVLKIPAAWIIALASALAYVTRYAMNSWGVLYLQAARGYSLPAAGGLMFISTVAGVIGALGIGYISDVVFKARRPPANLLFGLTELAGLGLVFYGPTNGFALSAGMVLFGLGMTGITTSVGGLFATDICPKRAVGATLGLMGVVSYLGAAIQEQVSGALLDKGATMVGDVRHYDFHLAIAFWIGASVLSLVLAASLWRVKLRD